MKYIKITMLVLAGFVIGAFAQNIYASKVKLIMVPEYIGNYKTIDLLNYMADLKDQEVSKITKIDRKTTKPSEKKVEKGHVSSVANLRIENKGRIASE